MVLAYQVDAAVRARRLEVVLAAFEPPPRPIQIVYPTTRLLSAKVRAFVDHLARHFGRTPYWDAGLAEPASRTRPAARSARHSPGTSCSATHC